MCKVITTATQKGGVGKTTTAFALATILSHQGYRVLAVDMDPQGNLSFGMNAEMEKSAIIYDVLKGNVKASFAIQHRAVVDTIPTNILLSALEMEFTGRGREFLLKTAIEPLKDEYDYIFIDSPPALGILTVNALAAADYVIVPMLPDVFSLQGLSQLYDTISHVRTTCNPSLEIAGILFNKFNSRLKLSREVHGTALLIAQQLGLKVFETTIRNCISLAEAQSIQCDVVDYAPKSTGIQDYTALAGELHKGGI